MSDLITKKLEETPDLLTIGEVSKLFKIHPDTLRNWEKNGVLVPLRVGPRKDRKYRKQDIEAIIAKMGSKLTLAQLEQFLWKSADILRGKIDSSDYKKYIFGLLFYKRISDVWDEEYARVIDEYKDKMLAEADYNHRFQVPKDCRWEVITQTSENIGQKLNDIFDKITNVNNPKLDKIFDDLDFANKDRFPNETIQRLVNHFSQYNFGSNYISSDLLGDAYEYLIKQFAADAGKKGGEFYTPREVERIIIGIVKPHQKDHVYDPTVGSGGFLLEAYNYLKDKSNEQVARTLYFYGQEINISTFAIAKINMFLHGLDSADIRRGDTLANPQFLNNIGNLQTFDIVVANPPYSIKDWEFELFKNDKYGRTEGYEQPPQKNADYAFVLHILKSLNANGRAGVVLPHGVLFRGGSEGRIREQIIKNDLLEVVIGLPPKLFYGTSIQAAILIFNRNKAENKKGKVLLIDAERDFFEGKNQNILKRQDIDKIIKAYNQYQDVEKYARVVDIKEIEENEFNLNVHHYIDSGTEKERIDVEQTWNELQALEKDREKILQEFENILKNYNIVNSNWKKVKLGDILRLEYGRGLPESKRIAGNIPVYGSNGIVGFHNQSLIQGEGIIVGRKGSIGQVHWAESDFWPIDTTYYVRDNNKYNFRWLYYVLKSLDLKTLNRGTGVPGLNREDVYKINISLPDKDIQQKIATYLQAVDTAITKATQIVQKTELLKQGIMQDIFGQNSADQLI